VKNGKFLGKIVAGILVGGLWLGGSWAQQNDCGVFPGGFAWEPSVALTGEKNLEIVPLDARKIQVGQAVENLGNHCCRKTRRGEENPQICGPLEKKLVGRNLDNIPASSFLVDQIFDVTMRFLGGETGENYGLAPDADGADWLALQESLRSPEGMPLDLSQKKSPSSEALRGR